MMANHSAPNYSLGEKIRLRLNQWLRDRRENRVVILHGYGEDDVRRKRFWYWKWEDYHRAGKVQVVPKWFSDCKVEELVELLQD